VAHQKTGVFLDDEFVVTMELMALFHFKHRDNEEKEKERKTFLVG
jgi:hypothetical protein